jgi:SAM-dependent methyltransferase
MSGEAYQYVGNELELFAGARRWKAYVREQVAPYLGGRVLEVGAGIGGTTQALCGAGHATWVCLEPDAGLAGQLGARLEAGGLPGSCRLVVGTLAELDPGERFDSVLYMDVIEHIADDRAELEGAAARLVPGGHLVVLVPAHGWLFTDFDRAIGHYRRYTRRTLSAAAPGGLERVRLRYLDSVGLLASLGNRLLLRQSVPTPGQIALWDGVMVRLSRWVDPLTLWGVGKSVLGVWRKPLGMRV